MRSELFLCLFITLATLASSNSKSIQLKKRTDVQLKKKILTASTSNLLEKKSKSDTGHPFTALEDEESKPVSKEVIPAKSFKNSAKKNTVKKAFATLKKSKRISKKSQVPLTHTKRSLHSELEDLIRVSRKRRGLRYKRNSADRDLLELLIAKNMIRLNHLNPTEYQYDESLEPEDIYNNNIFEEEEDIPEHIPYKPTIFENYPLPRIELPTAKYPAIPRTPSRLMELDDLYDDVEDPTNFINSSPIYLNKLSSFRKYKTNRHRLNDDEEKEEEDPDEGDYMKRRRRKKKQVHGLDLFGSNVYHGNPRNWGSFGRNRQLYRDGDADRERFLALGSLLSDRFDPDDSVRDKRSLFKHSYLSM